MPVPRVLIADDQPEILKALSFICSAEGYQTVTVNSPAAVVAKIGKEDFDVVLIDLNYRQDIATGKEGLDLLKQISAIDSSIPVVVMTAYASIQLAVEAVRLGAKDFLQKPWENERLLSILRTQSPCAMRSAGKSAWKRRTALCDLPRRPPPDSSPPPPQCGRSGRWWNKWRPRMLTS